MFGACFHLFMHRFLQQPPLRDERVSSWSSSVGPEFLSAPDPENQEIRPDLNRCPTRSPLATDPSSYSIQVEHYKKLPRGSSPTQHTWPSSVTLSTRSRPGATFDRQHKFNSWSLVSVRSALVVVVSPSHHRNCGIYFQLTFDSYTRSHNFSERLKTHYMQQSILHHWGSMSPMRHLLLLLLLLLLSK